MSPAHKPFSHIFKLWQRTTLSETSPHRQWIVRTLAISLLAALVSQGTAYGQGMIRGVAPSPGNSLTIQVVDPQGADLPTMIHVELVFEGQIGRMEGLRQAWEGYCDSKGYHTFPNLPDGGYQLAVSVPGRLPQQRSIQLSHGGEERVVILAGRAGAVTPEESAATVSVQWLAIPEKARRRYAKAQERFQNEDYERATKELQATWSVPNKLANGPSSLAAPFPTSTSCSRTST